MEWKNNYFKYGSLLLVVAFSIILLNSVSALENWTMFPHAIDLNENFGGDTIERGVTIRITQQNVWISGFNKTQNDLSTRGWIRSIDEVNLSTCTFVGDYCSFLGVTELTNGAVYILSSDGGGASVTRYRSSNDLATEIVEDWFNWNGTYNAGSIVYSDLWTIQALNISNNDPITLSIVLNTPVDNKRIPDTNIIFNATTTVQAQTIVNSTIYIWNETQSLINTTTNLLAGFTTNSTTWNITNFLWGNYTWNVLSCATNITTECEFSSLNRSFLYGFSNNSESYNTTSYETQSEGFKLNLTAISGVTLTSANLIFNNVSHTGTIVSSASDYIISSLFDIPASSGSKNFYWNLFFSNGNIENTTLQSQTVSTPIIGFCNATLNVPYLNFTFKDETTLATLDSLVDAATGTFWLGTGSVTKTFSFQNTTTSNPSYGICNEPAYAGLTLDLSFKYSNTSYPQRTFSYDDQTLTNVTTNQVLYLLGTADGIYSTFQVTETTGTPISGALVSIEREIGGTWTLVGRGTTGSDGGVTFWVNPNFNHRVTSSKSGYVTSQVTITPSQTLYTVTLSKTTTSADFSGSLEGVSWTTGPPAGYLAPGSHYFTFNLSANLANLDGSFCKFEIVNNSDTIVASTTGGNASGCNLGITYTHLAGERIFGKMYIDTTNTTGFFIIDADQRWSDIEGTDVKTWRSVYNFFSDLQTLDEWGEGTHRQEWNRTVGFFLFLTLGIGVFSFFTQWDSQYPGAAITMIFIVIMFASFSGWFALDIRSLENQGFDKIGKYAIAMVTAWLTAGWFFGYIRRAT